MGHDHEGQRVSRRRIIAGVSSVGLGALLTACGRGSAVVTSTGATVSPTAVIEADLTDLFEGANTCALTPSTTQGPYYFDADKIRTDIREDRAGTRLRIAIKLTDSEGCAPLRNAVVEIWHCDAAGLYSGAEDLSAGGGGRPGGARPGTNGGMADLTPTDDTRYLRGAQITNNDGIVEFTTIWPGWYRGRTTHIHAMVHVSNERVLTTQMMFDEAFNSAVYAASPYADHAGRDTFNDDDTIYRDSMLMTVTEDADGYLGVIIFGVDADQDGS